MSIFTVIQQVPSGEAGTLEEAIRNSAFPHYPVTPSVWLIRYQGTAVNLCGALGITPDGAYGTAVVTEVGSYYGRANPAIWTWIKQNWDGGPLG